MKSLFALLVIALGLAGSGTTAVRAADAHTPIVITYDSRWFRIGFAGDDSPRFVFPAVVGKPKGAGADVGLSSYVTGDEALSRRSALDLSYPVQHGRITDWNGFKSLIRDAFSQKLHVDPAGAAVLMTESVLNPKADREKLTQIMFDTFKVGSLYVAMDGVLALYASGRTTGLVDISESDITYLVPIYEGYALPHAIMRVDQGEIDVLQYLATLLKGRGRELSWPADEGLLRAIAEKFCYVAPDYDAEMQKNALTPGLARTYQIQGGDTITLATERFRAPEILLKPNLIGLEQEGMHKTVYDAIMKCDVDIRKDLYNNVVLAGCNTMYPGLDSRLKKEITALAPDSMVIKIVAPPERKESVWIGGSILASLSTFQQMWMTRANYDRSGAGFIHTRSDIKLPAPHSPQK